MHSYSHNECAQISTSKKFLCTLSLLGTILRQALSGKRTNLDSFSVNYFRKAFRKSRRSFAWPKITKDPGIKSSHKSYKGRFLILTHETAKAALPTWRAKLSAEYPREIFHVMNRGDGREPIFKDNAVRNRFVETLADIHPRFRRFSSR